MSKKIVFALLLALAMVIAMVPGFAAEESECGFGAHQYMKCTTCDKKPSGVTCEVYTEATCTENRVWCHYCNDCGTLMNPVEPGVGSLILWVESGSATGHTWSDKVVVLKEGNCDTKSLIKLTCEDCDAVSYKAEYVHEFEESYKDADCDEPAWAGEVCVLCGAIGEGEYVEDTFPTHSWVLDVEHEDFALPTCDEDGYMIYYCDATDCPILEETEEVATWVDEEGSKALGHNLKETETYVDPDCETAGGFLYACTRCDYTEVRELRGQDGELLDPPTSETGHDWEYGTPVAATCKAAGYTEKVCKVCGKEDKDAGAPKDEENGHKQVVVTVLKEATCTTNGIGKYKCELCGKDGGYAVISKDVAHDYVADDLTPATCGEDGELVSICSICGAEKTEPIPATGAHKFKDGYKKVSCDEPLYVGKICSVCDAVDGELQPAEGDTEPVGHDWVLDEENDLYAPVEPCSGLEGVYPYYCTFDGCDATKVDYVTDHHNFEATEIWVDASCGQDGGFIAICSKCEETTVFPAYDENGELVDPMPEGHEWAPVPELSKAPTCVSTGTWTNECQNCGAIATGNIAIDEENGHSVVAIKTLKPATCDTNGIAKFDCELCDEYDEYYGVLYSFDYGHDYVLVESKAPNCGESGYKQYECSICGFKPEAEILEPVGRHDYVDSFTEATCTENEFAGLVCSVCGATKGEMTEIEDTALGHDWTLIEDDEEYPYNEPTCDEDGNGYFYCARCDEDRENIIQDTIDALGHVLPEEGYMIDADCVNAAGMRFDCSVCDYYEVDVFTDANGNPVEPSLGGHEWDEGEEVEATCAEAGYITKTCEVCGETEVEDGDPINPANHVVDLSKVIKAPTCTTTGIGLYKCSACEANYSVYRAIPITHEWDEGTVISEANCGYGEEVLYECTLCDETMTEVGDPVGEHDWKENLVNDASTVIYKQCNVCGMREITVDLREEGDYTVCETFGHNYVDGVCTECEEEDPDYVPHTHKYTGVVTKATCTDDGFTTYTCECGDEYIDDVVKADGHTEEILPGVEADCTEPGLTAGKKCTVCGEVLVEQELIDALGHDYVDGVCDVCGAEDPDYVDPHTHDFTNAVKTVTEPTCTEKGYTTYTCECGEALIVDYVDAVGHTEEIVVGKAATCTEAGLEDGLKCTVCGETLLAQEVIPAKGHTEKVIEEVAATCTEAGLSAGLVCTVCDEVLVEQEVVAAKGHNEVVVPGKDAACGAAGLTEGKKCSVCGEVLVEQEEIPALSHDYKVTKWVFNEDITKKAPVYTCSVCGESYTGEWVDIIFE